MQQTSLKRSLALAFGVMATLGYGFLGGLSWATAQETAIREPLLARVTSDLCLDPSEIRVIVNAQGNLVGMSYEAPEGLRRFPLKQVRKGVDLMSVTSHVPFKVTKSIVKLKAINVDPRDGGVLTLTMLHDYKMIGPIPDFDERELRLELSRATADGSAWKLTVNEQNGRQDFNALHMRVNRVNGQQRGIRAVEFREIVGANPNAYRRVEMVELQKLPKK